MTSFLSNESLLYSGILNIVLFAEVLLVWVICRGVHKMDGNTYSLVHELTQRNNTALGVRYGSLLLAFVLSLYGVLHASQAGIGQDVKLALVYGTMTLGALLVSRRINDKFILYAFLNDREVIGEQNVPVALVEASTYLATAFIFRGAIAGLEGGILVSAMWFLAGQLLLIVLSGIYRLFVPQMFNELGGHNYSCALSLGGLLLAGGLALESAVSGPFNGWVHDLFVTGVYLGGWMGFMLIAGMIADKVLLPGVSLRKEVMEERNGAAGVLEGAAFVMFTYVYDYSAHYSVDYLSSLIQ